MADFKTHVYTASITGGLLSTLCMSAAVVDSGEMVLLWLACTLGGILPDIDSDNSSALKTVFNLFGIVAGFLLIFRAPKLSAVELWVVWLSAYLGVRYPLMSAFKDFSVHRGIFHSLPAALFFWFAVAACSYYFFGFDEFMAWALGFFTFIGFLVHLVLDEIYSVDLMHKRLKRSFGTALKLMDNKNKKTFVMMSAALLLTYSVTPNPREFFAVVTGERIYQRMAENFLPKEVLRYAKPDSNVPGLQFKENKGARRRHGEETRPRLCFRMLPVRCFVCFDCAQHTFQTLPSGF